MLRLFKHCLGVFDGASMTTSTRAELVLFIEGCQYAVEVAVLGSAYRVRKAGTRGWYAVELRPGGWECSCTGFRSYGRCRHCRSVREAGLAGPLTPGV